MATPKIAIIFYTTYGTNYEVAQVAADVAQKAGAEVRLRRVEETAPPDVVNSQDAWKAQLAKMKDIPVATPEDLVWADAWYFSTPTRYGGAASQMRAFIDTLGPVWQEGKLANKFVSATASAQNPHGGQETTLQTLYFTFMHWGAIIVPPGYTDEAVFASGGNPYGVSITATGEPLPEDKKEAIAHQIERLLDITTQYLQGKK